MNFQKYFILQTAILLFLLPVSVFPADLSLFAGGEIDTRGQGFSYLGVDITQKFTQNLSLAGRITPNYLTYRYRDGNHLIRAKSIGMYTVVGLKYSLNQTTLGIFGGAEYRNTDLNPDVRTAEVRGSTWAGLIQGEFDTWLASRTNINLSASFSGTDSFFYERGRIKRQISNYEFKKPNTINLGIEQFYGRNPDFRMAGGGLLLEVYHIPKKLSLALKGGYKHDSTFGSGGYGGLELFVSF